MFPYSKKPLTISPAGIPVIAWMEKMDVKTPRGNIARNIITRVFHLTLFHASSVKT